MSQKSNSTRRTVLGCVGHRKDSEAHRAICEARHWLQVTKGDPVAVNGVLARIAAQRGQAAADSLRDLMRAEWRKSQ